LAVVEEDDGEGDDDADLAEALSDVDDIMSGVFGDSTDDGSDTTGTAETDDVEGSGVESDGEDADATSEDEEQEEDPGT
jgi:hypothetical protein